MKMLKFENEKFSWKDKIGMSIILIALMLFFVQKILPGENHVDKKEIWVDNVRLEVEVMNSVEERYRGLSGREELRENEGMLFVHDKLAKHQYVMRGMKFDLDFIFIKNNQVVDIAKDVSRDYKGIIQGAMEYDKVLEVPAGWTDKNDIKLGDRVKF